MLLTLLTFVLPVTLVTFTQTYVIYEELDINWNTANEMVDDYDKYTT